MNTTKILSTVGVGAAIVVGSMLAVNAASAHGGGATEEQRAEHVSALAERFNLNEDEVKSYFEEQRAEHQIEREAERQERLANLVEAGTITQEQADALSAKHEEMRTAREDLKDQNLSRDETREKMQEIRSEFEAWAEEQGINLDDIRSIKGEGHGHRHHRSENNSDSSEDS